MSEQLNAIVSDPNRRAALEARYWPKVDRRNDNECWDWIAKATHPYGYGRMTAGRGVGLKAHQIAYALANGPTTGVIRHSCDRPQCCNPNHLLSGTHADNMADAKVRGRMSPPPHSFGEKHHNSKFSDQDALDIIADTRPLSVIAKQYNVSYNTVWRIRKGYSRRSGVI